MNASGERLWANPGTRPVRIRAGRGSREARNGVNRTVTPTTNTTRTVRARRGLNIVPRARPWSATRAPMRDKLKNIALCFSATAGSTGRAYLGLRDLDTVEGGGAEGAGGARLGRGDAGREDSDGGDDGSHGCVLEWSRTRNAIASRFWLVAIFWRDKARTGGPEFAQSFTTACPWVLPHGTPQPATVD